MSHTHRALSYNDTPDRWSGSLRPIWVVSLTDRLWAERAQGEQIELSWPRARFARMPSCAFIAIVPASPGGLGVTPRKNARFSSKRANRVRPSQMLSSCRHNLKFSELQVNLLVTDKSWPLYAKDPIGKARTYGQVLHDIMQVIWFLPYPRTQLK